MNITSIFNVYAITDAVSAQTQTDMANGRVNPTIAGLFETLFAGLGISLTQKGRKGASPRGAADALRDLCMGDSPVKKSIPAGVLASGQGWPEVAQALHAYVEALAGVGACAAPEPLPVWADPVAIAAVKATRAAKTKATREANKANAPAPAPAPAGAPAPANAPANAPAGAPANAPAGAPANAPANAPAKASPVEVLTPTSAINFLIAALRHDMDSVPSTLLDQLRALLHVDMPAPVAAPVAEVSMH